MRRIESWAAALLVLAAGCNMAASVREAACTLDARRAEATVPRDLPPGAASFQEETAQPLPAKWLSTAPPAEEEPRRLQPPAPASGQDKTQQDDPAQTPEAVPPPVPQRPGVPETISLEDVLRSLYASYPLVRVALQQRTIAQGQLLENMGNFDLKLKGGGTSGPLGFYRTHRYGAGLEQALWGGGEVFAGYRIGRGSFQPWYLERLTDDGGEFKAGLLIPLVRNRRIDQRRAAVFRAVLGREAVEPDILTQLIQYVRLASYAYWEWVAAGQTVRIEQQLLDIALQRRQGLQKRVEQGDLPQIELTDNERLIASRRASLIDAQRKFRQAAIKLSLFLRDASGLPVLPPPEALPSSFPEALPYDEQQLAQDIDAALGARPEIQYLDLVRQQLEVDLDQARNLYLPEVSVGAVAAKDVGPQASPKGDKRPFELEVSLTVSVPLQRRKALGKIQATQGKLAQVRTKTQFMREKIAAEVRHAVAALRAAYQRIIQARQSVELNQKLEEAERKRFEAGDSNLLMVNLREQATADARKTLVAAQLEYFRAVADLRAAVSDIPSLGE